ELIERLQQGAFAYLAAHANTDNGLIADTSRPGSPSSIAVVGMALTCYPVAVQRGWMTRRAAAALARTTLSFLWDSPQGEQPDASGYQGFFYHFLDMRSGRRVWHCELSVIDTALLMAGVLAAGRFFDGDAPDEPQVRALSEALYRRVDWAWVLHEGTLAQGWKPECGFLHYGWEGYNEATILYVLALGSPTHAPAADAFAAWTLTYQWENQLGRDVLHSGPLFTHLFSHAWIDFRGIRDAFMREKRSDYFENTRQAIAIQREYAARNPRACVGYGRDFWGITAGEGPYNLGTLPDLRQRRYLGYMARGVPFGPDDGTIAPWAMLACLPFDAEAALRGTRQLLEHHPQICPEDKFLSGFNPTAAVDGDPWVSQGWVGLDQGLLVMMIENHRSDLIWRLMRGSPPLRRGLKLAGFDGGWLR
ncbi:MAG: glucoamylase family protein, partial [Steroidobacteraceae bacterium]